MRKEIRDKIKSLIEPALINANPSIQVFAYCKGVIETGDPAVSIYFNTGDVTEYIDSENTEGQLNISILMPDEPDIDDKLDAIADIAEQSIESDRLLSGTLIESRKSRWVYDRTTFAGWTGLTLTYAINY